MSTHTALGHVLPEAEDYRGHLAARLSGGDDNGSPDCLFEQFARLLSATRRTHLTPAVMSPSLRS
jgi:hypothetical protein